MTTEQALITGVLVLSSVVGVAATVELATQTASAALHAVDSGERVAQDLGIGGGAGIGGGLTITVALRRNGGKGGKR